ncbi:MAG: flagellar filament capping protein FliD, partial [Lentisphaerota bacterium]
AVATKLKDYSEITLVGESPRGATVDETGKLTGDSLVISILNNMRKQVTSAKYPYLNQINAGYTYNGQTGVCDSFEDVGVWTASRENQVSVTDEDKLDYMLESNFEKVSQLFRGVYDSEKGYQHGVATDFYNYSNNVTTSLTGEIDRRVATLNDKVDEVDEDIAKKEKANSAYETRLWAQFTAMENAIAQMQSDLSYLTSKLGT